VLGDRALRLALGLTLRVVDETLLAIGYMRVVLLVLGTDVSLHGFLRLAFVEHEAVESLGVGFVLLKLIHISNVAIILQNSYIERFTKHYSIAYATNVHSYPCPATIRPVSALRSILRRHAASGTRQP
jgi:hypothetical protein